MLHVICCRTIKRIQWANLKLQRWTQFTLGPIVIIKVEIRTVKSTLTSGSYSETVSVNDRRRFGVMTVSTFGRNDHEASDGRSLLQDNRRECGTRMRPPRSAVCLLHVAILLGSTKPSHQSPDSTSPLRPGFPDVPLREAVDIDESAANEERRKAARTSGREEQSRDHRKWARAVLNRSDRRRRPYRRNLFRWVRDERNEGASHVRVMHLADYLAESNCSAS